MNFTKITKVSYVQLVVLHIVLGAVIFFFEFTARIHLVAVLAYFLLRIFTSGNKKDEVLLAAAYVTGFEVFSRMTGAGFSYEFTKYSVMGFLILGMVYKGFKVNSWPYILYLLLLVPGIYFSVLNLNYETDPLRAIAFNLSGPVCLGISALYCYDRKMPMERLQGILLSMFLPVISMTVYVFLFNPSIRDALSGTQSNYAASGGFGPNQVATAMGIAIFILMSRLFIVKNRLINIVDLLILGFIGYRGVITFSRGGIVTALVCAVAFIFYLYLKKSTKEKALMLPRVGLITGLVAVVWLISSFSTSGLINKRYSNQDAAGRIKEDITTGRIELISSELDIFYESPVTGIGVGKVKEYRMEKTGVSIATHNELTRLLSEHGVFGILALSILIFTPLFFRIQNRSNVYLFSFLAFWFLTINHSSMRIAAPAFIYGLCLISIVNVKKKKAIIRR
jgi:hypothetical protein